MPIVTRHIVTRKLGAVTKNDEKRGSRATLGGAVDEEVGVAAEETLLSQ